MKTNGVCAFCVLIAAVIAIFPAAAQCESVLWDLTHDGSGGVGYTLYNNMRTHLGGNGITFSTTSDISGEILSSYDAIVVSGITSDSVGYSAAEATKISDFVNDGGGLLVMCGQASKAYVQPIATEFGATLGTSSISGSTMQFNKPDPVLTGVDNLTFSQPGELLVSSPSSVLALIEDGVYKPIIAAAVSGSGHVVTVGDTYMMTDSLYNTTDNLQFIDNTFDYIVPEPATMLLLSSGAIALMAKKRR